MKLNMQDLRFNFCIPREYKDNDTQEIKYSLPKSGEKMNVGTIEEIQKLVKPTMVKEAHPWLQMFDNGYRVSTANSGYADWNGATFADIDSKHYFRDKKLTTVNTKKLLEAIDRQMKIDYPNNYVCSYITASKLGFRIVWFWQCERTEDNFLKCALLTEKYTRQLFYNLGDQFKDMIDYKSDGKKVLDSCSKSILQGMYLCDDMPLFNDGSNVTDFGECELDDIDLKDVYEVTNIVQNKGNIDQSEFCSLKYKRKVRKDNIDYYPHHLRRCVYEALVRLFKDEDKVQEEWKYICSLLPEANGHDKKFYLNEPTRNKWFQRYNNNIIHKLDWLTKFGYVFNDKIDYVFANQFKKSWRNHINNMIIGRYIDCDHIVEQRKKYIADKQEEMRQDVINTFGKLNAAEKRRIDKMELVLIEEFNSGIISELRCTDLIAKDFDECTEDEREDINELKKQYYKTKFDKHDFIHLINGYDKPNDIITYKMYADLIYRDENNIPTIKYDIREDEIFINDYYYATKNVQWHAFPYGNEYTHWKNKNTFDNKCTKTDLMEAINEFVPNNFAYNSFEEYLKKLDMSKANEELLETWAIRHFKCDDTPLTRFICKTFFVAAVKKQLYPDITGWAYPHILFIKGDSGCGKTFFLNTMFTFDNKVMILNKINPNDPDNIIGPLVQKNMLIQFGESASLKKADANTQKEFVDRMNMPLKFQKKYQNEQTTVIPRVMLCRTSNDDVLFNDISINDGDRRNLLLVCKTSAKDCDENMRKQVVEEKDILWVTAYKLYLENPEADLQLPYNMFKELAERQEEFKLTQNEDIKEIFDDIFDKRYVVNKKHLIESQKSFEQMVEMAEVQYSSTIGQLSLCCDVEKSLQYPDLIPVNWVKEYVKRKYTIGTYSLLRKYLNANSWISNGQNYMGKSKRCWIRPHKNKNI